jgi:hypothetical protein
MAPTRRLRLSLPAILAACLLFTGCTVTTLPVAERSPAGSFLGVTADHRPIRLTIAEAPEGFIGYGELDGAPFSVTFLTRFQGVGVLTHDDRFLPLEAELSFDGERLRVDAFGSTVELYRAGPPPRAGGEWSSGRLAGRYRSGGSGSWVGELELAQKGNLVLGSGNVYGRAFVVSGIVTGADAFGGRAVFGDGSEARVEGFLDGAGQLTVDGLAGRVEFRR